ncbi:hypothetical protein ACIBEJ_02630 [Nonomuraea sp. NPDC050790]|uniref:hypothetical protein n=1 Tax=Nonomuraea sp. NPDC050790 TaxID=3364371 RepID=UPI0037B6EF46
MRAAHAVDGAHDGRGVVGGDLPQAGGMSRRGPGAGPLRDSAPSGYTDMNAFRGHRPIEEGAAAVVRLATLPDDGPTGGRYDDRGPAPWWRLTTSAPPAP